MYKSTISMLVSVFLFLAAPVYASKAPLPGDAGLLPSPGKYVVQVYSEGKWVEASRISANKHINQMHADLSGFVDKGASVRVRIKAIGGNHAHLDAITLGGNAPSKIKDADNIDPMNKLMKRDLDMIDATGKTVEVEFQKNSGELLVITGRIEPLVISKEPFLYPLSNLYKGINTNSQFYTYDMNSPKSSKPFFKEMSYTGSGHPDGFTYGWVTHDEDNLYVGLDYTADNTIDGPVDYTKVFVKTEDGVKEFKVTAVDNKWGEAFFTYTDKVAYQHKVYQFAIPMAEIAGKDTDTLELAFAAYGTGAPAALGAEKYPSSAFDSVNERHLVVFEQFTGVGGPIDIYGRFMDTNAQQVGSDFVISDQINNQSVPGVTFNSDNDNFLVVWHDERNASNDIYGQFVDASDGSLLYNASDMNFAISNQTSTQSSPAVASNAGANRVLVTWADGRNASNDIYGQFINSLDGTHLFNTVGENFAISNATNTQNVPDVSYDSTGDRFLVTWYDYRSGGNWDIYGQFVNSVEGSLVFNTVDVNFPISTQANDQTTPALSYDSTGDRFLVTWHDNRNATYDIYGQFVNATDGSLLINTVDQNLIISNAPSANQFNSAVASTGYGAYLVVWADYRDAFLTQIFGMGVDASDGALISNSSSENHFIMNSTDNMVRPALSFDPCTDQFLVSAYTDDGAGNMVVKSELYPDTASDNCSGGGGGDTPAADTSSGGGGGCFIATAAYGSYSDAHVMALRAFRDDVLFKSKFGTRFVDAYYTYSPPVADFIAQHPALRAATRVALAPVVYAVKYPVLIGFVFAGMGGALIGIRRRKKCN